MFGSVFPVFLKLTAQPPSPLDEAQTDTLMALACGYLKAVLVGCGDNDTMARNAALNTFERIIFLSNQLNRLEDLRSMAPTLEGFDCHLRDILNCRARIVRRKQKEDKPAPAPIPKAAVEAAEAAMKALLEEEERGKAQQEAKKAEKARQKAKAKMKQAPALVQPMPAHIPQQSCGSGSALSAEDEDQINKLRDTVCCPITQVLFRDSVIAADGQTYERAAIVEWLDRHNTSPMLNGGLVIGSGCIWCKQVATVCL
ncbi:hypothetical protein WJX72_011044 [[Myrmecia] bisecta]|uniref:U-box domain-containing protein n=1 Tax=[Myrmecia] bisecta TaxID=41462 RepID=A0AAW1R9K0_9CHLO